MSLKILEKIDSMIADMEQEVKKVRKARVRPNHHVNFVTEDINGIIKKQTDKYPDDPVKVLGYALSKVGESIAQSFERIDTIEGNIIVAIQAYKRVKNEILSIDNEADNDSDLGESDVDSDLKPEIRKIGTRPKNKIASRRKESKDPSEKPKKRRASKKKKTAKVEEE